MTVPAVRRTPLPLLLRPLVLWGLLALVAPAAPLCADDRMPGEAAELTEEVRAKAQKEVEALCAAPDLEAAKKPRRALLVMGPAVWPVIENRMKLLPPAQTRPHFAFLKALLVKKDEPEFEHLRGRLRRVFLMDALQNLRTELANFRVGRPDPAKPGQKIPPTARPKMIGTHALYRSGDGSIVVLFGGDGTDAAPDSPDIDLTEDSAGFVAAVSGKPRPAARHSGKGGVVNVTAPMGFAVAWASDGAEGMRPGGEGGEGGSPKAVGGAGMHERPGAGGPGAPGG
jgi:hypothetical protein